MQIKNNQSNYLQKPWLIRLLKIVLLTGCLYFIYAKMQSQALPAENFQWPPNVSLTVAIVVLLMVINWYLESLRWKVSIEVFESITIYDAWKVVLGGLTLNWILPFTTGDFIARVSQQQDKIKASSAALFNRAIMLILTSAFGLYGIAHVSIRYEWNEWFIGAGSIIIILLIIFRKFVRRFVSYFQDLDRSTIVQVGALSVLRYCIFVTQFFLLLNIFQPLLDDKLILAGIGWIFLARTAIPLIMGGVGVREASGIIFFEPYVHSLEYVLIPIFMIWVINIVIPSLVGLVFIMRLRTSEIRPDQSSS